MKTSGLFKTKWLGSKTNNFTTKMGLYFTGREKRFIKFLYPVLFFLFLLLPFYSAQGQEIREYKVYKKISPCSGRLDWIFVAKENPVWGLSFHELANTECDRGCNYIEAMNVAERVRWTDEFYNYCCKDYSVWYKYGPNGVKEYTIVLGRFGSAGQGYYLEKANLCCEEAEILSGISTGCNSRGEIVCPAGSYSAWNPQTQKSECFCYPGYQWNSNKTACISTAPDCEKSYPNSIAIWDNSSNQYLCRCKQGFEWNATRTACVPVKPDCNSYYKNSVAIWDDATKQYLCNCITGYVWNATRTECIPAKPDCDLVYDNSVAEWDEATKQYVCNCIQGYQWNATRTACIPAKPDCNSYYKNSVASWDDATKQYLCNCITGYDWNAARTECIPAKPDCNSYYKNSVAIWDDATKQYTCNCMQGYQWNAAKTECITAKPDCNLYYKNSVATWDDATKQYLCNCPKGYGWNAQRTECVLIQVPDCNSFYKNSVAKWDDATWQYLCNCPKGYGWNNQKTECILLQVPDCNSYYKNSVTTWDDATWQYMCNCPQGFEWNANKTECIPGSGNRDNPVVNPDQKKQGDCNVEYKSGANEPEQYTIDVKSNFGKLDFSYKTYNVKDRIHIYYGGSKVFDTGCVGTSGSQTLTLNGSSSIFTIIVDPQCDGNTSDTNWNFTLGCPTN